MKLDFNATIETQRHGTGSEYRKLIEQFVKSSAPTAEVKLSLGQRPSYTASYFRALIKEGKYPVMVIVRGSHVYLIRGVSDAE